MVEDDGESRRSVYAAGVSRRRTLVYANVEALFGCVDDRYAGNLAFF